MNATSISSDSHSARAPLSGAARLVWLALRCLVGTCAVVAAVGVVHRLIAERGMGEERDATTTAPAVAEPVVTTHILFDENQRVLDDEWTVYRFRLDQRSEIDIELLVTHGGAVNAYVLANGDYANFPNGQWRQYEVFRAAAKSQHRAIDVLGPGDYVLIVKESSNPNIFGGSDNAFVRVRLTSKTTTFRGSLGGAIAPPGRTSEQAPSHA